MGNYKDLTGNRWLKDHDQTKIGFATQQEMVDAMKRPEYHTDPDYRAVVSRMIANGEAWKAAQSGQAVQSGPVDGRTLARALSDPQAARKQQDVEIARFEFQRMFTKRNPETGGRLYEESPTYRREVEDFLRANNDAIDAASGNAIIDRSQAKYQPMRVVIGQYEDQARHIREDRNAKIQAQADEEMKEAHARLDRGEEPWGQALDGSKV